MGRLAAKRQGRKRPWMVTTPSKTTTSTRATGTILTGGSHVKILAASTGRTIRTKGSDHDDDGADVDGRAG
jgi:hypothetical protein